MAERMRVAVYGCSLSMAGIAASLAGEAGLAVACVAPSDATARQRLEELDPAVVVFDLSNPTLALDITLVRARPGRLLIGVDPSSDEVLVMSSRSAQALSVADLLRIIAQGTETDALPRPIYSTSR